MPRAMGRDHPHHASFRRRREDEPARGSMPESAAAEDPPAPDEQKHSVRLTHPGRLYWPHDGITKKGLAEYWAAVWRHAAPFLTGRPLALVRCPEGIDGPRFFQKHIWKGIGSAVMQVQDPRAPGGTPLLAIRDFDGLMALVQGASLEIHPWGARVADMEHPDLLVMDLDPGPDVAWPAVIAAAREVRARLEAAGLAAFVKTSGGKGLHVVSPLRPEAGWRTARAFTKSLAEAMAADSPDLFTASISKARRKRRILIDFLRNQRGATAVAPWSSRAWPGAPVSMPLAWDELDKVTDAGAFTIANTADRLAGLEADPWGAFHAAAVPLKAA